MATGETEMKMRNRRRQASRLIEKPPRLAKVLGATLSTMRAAVTWFRLMRSGFLLDDGGFCKPQLKSLKIQHQYTPEGGARLHELLAGVMYLNRIDYDHRGKPFAGFKCGGKKRVECIVRWVLSNVSTRGYAHLQDAAEWRARWDYEDMVNVLGITTPRQWRPASFEVSSANPNSKMKVWFA